MEILHDEDSESRNLLAAFASAGLDCVTTSELGRAEQSDESQLEFATAIGRVLFTANVKDFGRLHRLWMHDRRSHAGIILLTEQRADIGLQLRCMLNISARFSQEELRNQVLFLLNWA